MYETKTVTGLWQLTPEMTPCDMYDGAQDLLSAGVLNRKHYVNNVSGTLFYTLAADGKPVVDIDIGRGFQQPYNDRLEDVFRAYPTSHKYWKN